MQEFIHLFVGVVAALVLVELGRWLVLWPRFGKRLWRAPLSVWRIPVIAAGWALILRYPEEFWWWPGYAALTLRPLGGPVVIYEEGICAGTMVLRWSEIRGWAFAREGEWGGEPQALTWTPAYPWATGSGQLYLWSDSPWYAFHRRIWRFNWRQPLRVNIGHSPELAALLRAYAPELVLATAAKPKAGGQVIHSL